MRNVITTEQPEVTRWTGTTRECARARPKDLAEIAKRCDLVERLDGVADEGWDGPTATDLLRSRDEEIWSS